MQFRFFLSEAINSLVRNWVMSVAAVVTVLVSMFILGVGAFIFFNLESATSDIKNKLEIEVFIDKAASEEEIDQLGDDILAMQDVKDIKFVSEEEALSIMRERLKGNEDILEALSGNPLPASYRIFLKNPENIDSVADALYGYSIVDKRPLSKLTEEIESGDSRIKVASGEGLKLRTDMYVKLDDEVVRVTGDPEGDSVPVSRGQSGTMADSHGSNATVYEIDGIKTGGETTERVLKVTNYILIGGAGFVLLLAVASVLLISNTIRLSIFARRREVEIMRLVGATNNFIRWPFVIEGITTGLVGAVMALIMVLAVENFFVHNIINSMPFLGAKTMPVYWLALFLIGGGVLLGSVGSGLALRRFLRI